MVLDGLGFWNELLPSVGMRHVYLGRLPVHPCPLEPLHGTMHIRTREPVQGTQTPIIVVPRYPKSMTWLGRISSALLAIAPQD